MADSSFDEMLGGSGEAEFDSMVGGEVSKPEESGEASFDNMLGTEPEAKLTEVAPEVPDIDATQDAESLRAAEIGKGTIQGAYMTELLSPSPAEVSPLPEEPILRAVKNTLVD